jgi:hypothetical protein
MPVLEIERVAGLLGAWARFEDGRAAPSPPPVARKAATKPRQVSPERRCDVAYCLTVSLAESKRQGETVRDTLRHCNGRQDFVRWMTFAPERTCYLELN